ncbi:hypothetical protein DFH06DRAFT_1467524 [Mycena polygramma]|nr:hypothetical protein DFH06DRAFT_1467524 [Mycena polygramma]
MRTGTAASSPHGSNTGADGHEADDDDDSDDDDSGECLFAPVQKTVLAYPGTPAAGSGFASPALPAASPFAIPMQPPTMSPDAILRAYASMPPSLLPRRPCPTPPAAPRSCPASRAPACACSISSPRMTPTLPAPSAQHDPHCAQCAPKPVNPRSVNGRRTKARVFLCIAWNGAVLCARSTFPLTWLYLIYHPPTGSSTWLHPRIRTPDWLMYSSVLVDPTCCSYHPPRRLRFFTSARIRPVGAPTPSIVLVSYRLDLFLAHVRPPIGVARSVLYPPTYPRLDTYSHPVTYSSISSWAQRSVFRFVSVSRFPTLLQPTPYVYLLKLRLLDSILLCVPSATLQFSSFACTVRRDFPGCLRTSVYIARIY